MTGEGRMQPFKAFKLTTVEKSIRAEFVDCKLEDLDPGELVRSEERRVGKECRL